MHHGTRIHHFQHAQVWALLSIDTLKYSLTLAVHTGDVQTFHDHILWILVPLWISSSKGTIIHNETHDLSHTYIISDAEVYNPVFADIMKQVTRARHDTSTFFKKQLHRQRNLIKQ